MTLATRLTCDWHGGCEAERPPYSERHVKDEGWSHFAIRTDGKIVESDLCPAHALAVRDLFGTPR